MGEALSFSTAAADRLWKPAGREARDYFHRRCLSDETIRAARLGWTDGIMIPRQDGRPFKVHGYVVPWFDTERLCLVKIRRPDDWLKNLPVDKRPRKYIEAFRDRPRIYPGPAAVLPGLPLITAEGEFDCWLLTQELRDLAGVVTLGSASNHLDQTTLDRMLTAPIWFLGLDQDPAGNKAALSWPARADRIGPPTPFKDWTEAAQGGINLRLWWAARLGRETLWRELAGLRW
jgi:hypothetical protein